MAQGGLGLFLRKHGFDIFQSTTPFFVSNNSIKVNKKNYCRHLRKKLFPAIEKVIKRDD